MNRILWKANDNTNENQLKKGGDVLDRGLLRLLPKFAID